MFSVAGRDKRPNRQLDETKLHQTQKKSIVAHQRPSLLNHSFIVYKPMIYAKLYDTFTCVANQVGQNSRTSSIQAT